MNTGGETADQMVRMTLQGIEVAANIALKIGGDATKSLAATLYAIITDKKKVKGRASLDAMLKSGKELKVFAIRHEDLKVFCEEAKHYGVLYSVLKEKNNTSGICDIMVRAEDASKITRIVDKFELATIDTKAIKEAILAEKQIKDIPTLSEEEHDELIKQVMDESQKKSSTRKKGDHLFEPISTKSSVAMDSSSPERPSVRKQLEEIKDARKQTSNNKQPRTKQKIKVKKRGNR